MISKVHATLPGRAGTSHLLCKEFGAAQDELTHLHHDVRRLGTGQVLAQQAL
jgi:hypothetical protein